MILGYMSINKDKAESIIDIPNVANNNINMKKINYLFICLLLSAAVVVGCKSDDGGEPGTSPEEKAVADLQGKWEVTSAKRDNSDLEGYDNMVLTVSNKSLATAGATASPSVFPTGSFTFVEGSDYKKITVDGITVTLTANGENLNASFKLDDEGNNAARVQGLDGSYAFTFKKQ